MKTNLSLQQKLIIHFTAACLLFLLLLVIVFYNVLPKITRANQFIKVPDLKGLTVESATYELNNIGLCANIQESNKFYKEYEQDIIINQIPSAFSFVKLGRKIYLTKNTKKKTVCSIPNLLNSTIKNAVLELKNKGLKVGKIKYVEDITDNCILEQKINEKDILPGANVSVDEKIDFVIGLNSLTVKVPSLKGIDEVNIREVLILNHLELGSITYEESADTELNKVMSQNPNCNDQVSAGSLVNIVIAKKIDNNV